MTYVTLHNESRSANRSPAARSLIWPLLLCALFIAVFATSLNVGHLDLVGVALVCIVVGLGAFSIWLVSRSGPVDPFHPLVYPLWFYLLPMAVIRPLYLANGNYSYYLGLTSNPAYFFHLALIYMIVGWSALLVGYHLPFLGNISAKLRCPRFLLADLRDRPTPLVAYGVGLVFVLILIVEHAYGSSLSTGGGNTTTISVVQPLSQLTSMALFLLVYGPPGKKSFLWKACLGLAIGISFILGVISGSRGGLPELIILMAAAWAFSRPGALPWRRLAPWILGAGMTLLVTTLIVTQYRSDRQSQFGTAPISVSQTASLLEQSIGQVSTVSIGGQASSSVRTIMDRLDSVDLLGVTLSQAPHVKAQEQQVGIDNNIVKESFWVFVPRFVDPGKPQIGNFGLWFTRIYLNSPYLSSNGPTVFGDLYRNFGTVGVILGLMFLGAYFRLLYGVLVQASGRKPIALLLYFSLLTAMNWEGEFTSWYTFGERVLFAVLVLWAVLRPLNGFRRRDAQGAVAASVVTV